MRALLQSRQIVAVKAPLRAIKRLSADPKVPTSPPSVPAIEKIEQHPLEPGLRGPAPHLPEAASWRASGSSHHLILLIPTLYRVSPVILNEHREAQIARYGLARYWGISGGM